MKSIPRPLWTFLLVGIFIGAILIFQGKSGVPPESGFPLDQLSAQKAVLQSFNDEQQKLEATLVSLRKQIADNEDKLSQYTGASQKEQLEALKEKAGLTEISGPGISIFLADSSQVDRDTADPNDDALVSAADLRDTVNLLFQSGAGAVAINGKRILPLSSINFVGDTFLINDFHVFPPFTIQAIGSKDVLLARLKDSTLLPSLQKRSSQGKIRFFAQEREKIDIPAFDGTLRTELLTASH